MKKIFSLLLSLFTVGNLIAQNNSLSASMDKVKLDFRLNNGKPEYAVYYDGKVIIKPSAMGFKLAGNASFTDNFTLLSSETKMVDTTWSPVWGEVKQIRNHYQ